MSDAVTFMFSRFEIVEIVALSSNGMVHSRMNNATGVNEYKVIYWIDGKKMDDWFYELELNGVTPSA